MDGFLSCSALVCASASCSTVDVAASSSAVQLLFLGNLDDIDGVSSTLILFAGGSLRVSVVEVEAERLPYVRSGLSRLRIWGPTTTFVLGER